MRPSTSLKFAGASEEAAACHRIELPRTNVRKTSVRRRLQPLRHLDDRSGCFRLELSPGGACNHWKVPPLQAHTHSRRSDLSAAVVQRIRLIDDRGEQRERCDQRANWSLLDYLVGAQQQRLWNRQSERLRGPQLDHQLEYCRLQHRQAGGLGAVSTPLSSNQTCRFLPFDSRTGPPRLHPRPVVPQAR